MEKLINSSHILCTLYGKIRQYLHYTNNPMVGKSKLIYYWILREHKMYYKILKKVLKSKNIQWEIMEHVANNKK